MPSAVTDYNVAIDDTTGYVYIVGGRDTVQTCAGPLTGLLTNPNQALKYDIPNDAWSTLPDMPEAFYRLLVALLMVNFT